MKEQQGQTKTLKENDNTTKQTKKQGQTKQLKENSKK